MPFNVSPINNTLFATPQYSGTNRLDAKNFVKNAYAVQGDVNHPEGRTNYSATDNKGQNLYLLM